MRDKYEQRFDSIREWVIPQYFDKNGRKNISPGNDVLESASRFSRELSIRRPDLYPISGDDSSVRKRIYPDLLREVQIFTNIFDQK